MTAAFQELIKNAKLTKKERLIADYVLNNFRDLCFMTSTELANTLSVSHSSVMLLYKRSWFFRIYRISAYDPGAIQYLHIKPFTIFRYSDCEADTESGKAVKKQYYRNSSRYYI